MYTALQGYSEYHAAGAPIVAAAELLTVIFLLAAFVLFLFLAVRFRHSEGGILRSFKLQLSVAILFWILGEAFALSGYYSDVSMYVHTISMALFAFFLIYRARALLTR
jgi:hypothetical protein